MYVFINLMPFFTILLWLLFVLLCPLVLTTTESICAIVFAALCLFALQFIKWTTFENSESKDFILTITKFAFTLRLVSALIVWVCLVHWGYGHPFQGGTLDDSGYDRLGWGLAMNWLSGGPFFPTNLHSEGYYLEHQGTQVGFHYFTGIIYLLIGRYTIVIRIINAFISAITIPYVYNIAKNIYHSCSIAERAAFLCAIFPMFLLYSGLHLKDTIVYFLIVLIIYKIYQINNLRRIGVNLVLVIFGLLALFFMRSQTALALFVILICFFIVKTYKVSAKLFIVMVVLILGLSFEYFRIGFFGANLYYSVLYTMHSREDTGIEKSLGGHIDWDSSEKSSLSRKAMGIRGEQKWHLLPIAVIYTLITPFPPWLLLQRMGIGGIFYTPGMLLWLYLLPLLWIGVSYSLRFYKNESFMIYILTLLTYIAIALMFEGAAWRYRLQVDPMALILASVGYQVRYERQFAIKMYWAGLFTGIILYLLLKH